MKRRTYRKPALYIESFQLMDHIAGNCGGVENAEGYSVTHRSVLNCAFLDPDSGEMLFIDYGNNCTYLEDEKMMNVSIDCYNYQTGNYAYFAS